MPTGVYKRTEEAKKNISKSLRGKKKSPRSEEHKRNLSKSLKGHNAWNKDIPCSGETKKKISEALKGIKNPNYGKHRTEETKKKISESHKGIKASKKTKMMMSKMRKGNKIKEETKRKLSESLRGEKCHLWKGGITQINLLIRQGFKYRQWRSDIFTRDDFTCQECGQWGGRLHAHHIKSFSSILQYYEITTLEEALDCEELWNINNGVTLCKECHKRLHKGVMIGEYFI